MAKSYNRSTSGQAGTGSAFILPKSRAFENLLENIDNNRKQGLLNIQQQRANSDATNKAFLDNQIKAKSGILFQDQLNSATQKWMDQGAKYRVQGFNPFSPDANDPNQVQASQDYIRDKSMIEGMADTRDLYQKNYLDQIERSADGTYDEDSVEAFKDFYSKANLTDLMSGGVLPPSIMKRFDTQGFLKNIDAPSISEKKIVGNQEISTVTPNKDAIRYNVETAMRQAPPQARREFNKIFGIDESKTPARATLGTVDPAEVFNTLDQYYKSPAGAKEAVAAFPKGSVVSYNSPEYKKFVENQSAKQIAHEQRWEDGLNTIVEQKSNGVDTKSEFSYNFDLEDQRRKREDQAMERRRLQLAEQSAADSREDRKEKKSGENLRDMNIQGIQVGDREAMNNLRQLARAKGGKVGYDKQGRLVVEFKEKLNGEYVPREKVIDLSQKKNDGYFLINELMNELTGKKVDMETLQGRTRYSGGLVNVGDKSITKDQVEYLRSKFKTTSELGEFFINNKMFKTSKEALEAAGEILDKQGRIHKNVNKPKPK